ncbi:MAG TPA: polysaccharide biosynthesis/export family protein [Candidatus Eisenbacteria bacterium]|nr:polysaccharide biosynthesis/export family protein [Candidatus Eisenbacteria bacterium]
MGRVPAKLGHALWCLMVGGLAWTLAQAPPICAQAQVQPQIPAGPELETQQKTNQRILELSRSTHTPPHDYVVGRGDLVVVEVFDVPELTREVRVSQSGTIGIPLVPVRLYVVGLTEMQVQQKIAEVLEANGLVSHAQVLVSVKEKKSKPIAIVGAVAHPMVYQADRPVSLIEVLAEAGGISNDAGDTVIITRPEPVGSGVSPSAEPPEISSEDLAPAANPSSPPPAAAPRDQQKDSAGSSESANANQAAPVGNAKGQQEVPSAAVPPPVSASDATPLPTTITVNLAELLERGDLQNNIPLQAGDVVTVPHAGIVYALGAVARPGGFVATNDRAQLSTLKILALAGGTTAVAKRDQAVIIRKDSTGKQHEIPVDLAKIVKRESEDVQLKPSDILYVPPSAGKAVLIRAAEIAAVVGTAVAIYRIGNH